MSYECRIDDGRTLLIGDIEEVDESFDHAFGFEKRAALEIRNFSVITYIEDFGYDITKALKPKELEYFKERFFEHAKRDYEADLAWEAG